jgi:hypothetical protein
MEGIMLSVEGIKISGGIKKHSGFLECFLILFIIFSSFVFCL